MKDFWNIIFGLCALALAFYASVLLIIKAEHAYDVGILSVLFYIVYLIETNNKK